MKNINIPEPCSENWNEMTPTDKGAFCQKCALEVHDFTDMSSDQIREVLTLNLANPVCMKIESKQLDQLNSDFAAWKINNQQSYHRAWVFTLFVVFGMTLFSCEEDEELVVKKYQEIGQTILSKEKIIDPIRKGHAIVKEETEINQQRTKAIALESNSPEVQEICVKGEIAYGQEEEVVVEMEEIVVSEFIRHERTMTTGGVPMITRDYSEYLVELNPGLVADSLTQQDEDKITGLAYPNPASNHTTLQVNMPSRGKVDIQLFAMTGQRIRTIHSGRIKKGESEYGIDLTKLETGFYLVVIQSGELKETVKFSKL